MKRLLFLENIIFTYRDEHLASNSFLDKFNNNYTTIAYSIIYVKFYFKYKNTFSCIVNTQYCAKYNSNTD